MKKNSALSHYVGRAASSEQMQRSNIQSSLSTLSTLNVGTHELDNSVVVIKRIGEAGLPLGKFALKFSLQEALNDTRRQFIASVAPIVGVLILIFFIITHRLQRRSLRPLAYLIETMNSVVSEHNYDVEVKTFRKKETAALSSAFNNMMANIRSQTLINKQKTDLLIGQQQEVERLANLDPLTNLPNKHQKTSCLNSKVKSPASYINKKCDCVTPPNFYWKTLPSFATYTFLNKPRL